MFKTAYHRPQGPFSFNREIPAAIGASDSGPLPTRNVPDGLHAMDSPTGGRILYGPVSNATSLLATFQTGIERTRGYFDTSPHLLSAIGSKDGRLAIVVFSAALGAMRVNGLMLAAYDPDGHSYFAVVFDDSTRLFHSLKPMMEEVGRLTEETIEKTRSSGGGAPGIDFAGFEATSHRIALRRITFPDNTATIGVASGFVPQQMSVGSFVATAEDGSYIRLFMPASVLDPRGSLYRAQAGILRSSGGRGLPGGQVAAPYNNDPVRAWKTYLAENARANGNPDPSPQVYETKPVQGVASGWVGRFASGTMTLRGTPYIFTGMLLVGPPPGPDGGWMLQITMLGAPKQHAAADMPALIAMRHSIKIDREAVRDQTMRNIEKINEQSAHWLAANRAAGDAARNRRFESSMANARATRDAMDRSTAGFINHIRGTEVVQHNATGAHATVDKDFASALERADPQRFSPVPISKYIKGVDY